LSTWFALDLCIVLVDVLSRLFFVGGGGVLGRIGKAWRVVRIMKAARMMRLARAAKLFVFLTTVLETTVSKSAAVTVTIFRLLLEVAIAVHFIACAWFAVGVSAGEGKGWVAAFDINDKGYMYLLSFHWAIAQFTPAPNNIHATNFPERLFATVVLFVGLVIFSSLIGRVTALVTQRQKEAMEQMLDIDRLRTLCATRTVALPIFNRLLHNVKRAKRPPSWVLVEDVGCLSKVPRALLNELRFDIYGRALAIHPLFRMPHEFMRTLVKWLSEHVVKEVRVPTEEVLFRAGELAHEMQLLVHGQCEYKVEGHIDASLTEGTCLCEGALWTTWERCGQVSAVTPCSVVAIPYKPFCHVVERRMSTTNVLRRYAQHFVERLHEALEEDIVVDDTWKAVSGEDDMPAILLQRHEGSAPQQSFGDSMTDSITVSGFFSTSEV